MTGSQPASPRRLHPRLGLIILVAIAAFLAPGAAFGSPSDADAPTGARSTTDPSVLPGEVIVHNVDPTGDTGSPALMRQVDAVRAEQRELLAWQRRASAPSRTAASVVGDISVSYLRSTPADVQDVVEAAIADWNDVLVTTASGPVHITFDWVDLSQSLPGTLGFAGPTGFFRRSDGLYYPVALANTLDRTDYTPSGPEIEVTLSSSFYNRPGGWYVDASSASVPSNRLDLYATVLHEVGHGLGFLGSAERRDGVDRLQSPPDRYDTLVRYRGSRLVDLPNSGDLLTSQELFIDIGGGLLHELYAPSQFFNGSSFSHFDEASYPTGQPGSLMTPALGAGQTERVIDAPTLGVLVQSGWQSEVPLLRPSITGADMESGAFTVSWTVPLSAAGVPPQSYRVRAVRTSNGQVDADTTVSGTTRMVRLSGLTNGVTYRLEVAPLGFAASPGAASVTHSLLPPPAAPSLITINGSGLARSVGWQLGDDGGSPVIRYEIDAARDGGGFARLGTSTSRAFTTATLANDVYQFRVRAVTANGAGPYGYSLPIGFTDTVVRPFPLDGEVARLYQAVFDRLPDPGGMSFYLNGRSQGRTLSSIANEFLLSPEFVSTYGSLADRAFIEQLYRNVLGRNGEQAGVDFWTNELRSGRTRSNVVIEFAQSPEFVTLTGTAEPQTSVEGSVYRLYLAYFLRPADQAGFDFYVDQARTRSLASISNDFASSPEFSQRYGSLSNTEFLDLVYANVLTRTPDAAGYSFWLDQMQRGVPRGDVMLAFSESPEFIVRTGTTR